MKLNKDIVIFELVGGTTSNYEDKHGRKRSTIASLGIPAITTMLYEDEDGDTEIRRIRYVKSLNTIFVDEQNELIPEGTRINRQVSKPQFTDGLLAVKAVNKNLIEFLRNHPMNEANAHWGLDRQRTVFREKDPAKEAKKLNTVNKQKLRSERLVYESDFLTQIVPVAQYLGIDIDRDSDLVIWDVKQFATNNPDRFVELLDSPIIQRFSDIRLAEEFGFIRMNGQRIQWADGRQLVEAPLNYNPREYLAEVSFEDKYHSAWAEIQRLLNKKVTKEEDAEVIASNTDKGLDEISNKELGDGLIEAGIIKWEKPYFVLDGTQRLGRSKESVYEYVGENKKVLAARLV